MSVASDGEMSNRCFATRVGSEGGKEARSSTCLPNLVAAACGRRSATERKDRALQHENFEDVSARHRDQERASVECLQTHSRGSSPAIRRVFLSCCCTMRAVAGRQEVWHVDSSRCSRPDRLGA